MTALDSKARDTNTVKTINSKHRRVTLPRDKKWRRRFMAGDFTVFYEAA
jgi:hypothetical protein